MTDSNNDNARKRALAVIVVLCGAVAAAACGGSPESSREASPTEPAPDGPTLEVVSVPMDAREIFERYGVGDPDGDAEGRPDLTNAISAFQQRVSHRERHRYGGLYIRREPEYGVVVLLTSGDLSDIEDYVPDRLRGLVDVRNVERALAELRAMQERISRLRSVMSFDSSTNVHRNIVELGLIGPTRADLEAAARAIGDAAAQSGEPLPAWVTVVGSVVPLEETPGEMPDWLLRHPPVGSGFAYDALLRGVLKLDFERGCVLLSGQSVIWPAGTTLSRDPPRLNLPGGMTADPGDEVSGGGGHVPVPDSRQASSWLEGDLAKARACATEPGVMLFGPRAWDMSVAPGG